MYLLGLLLGEVIMYVLKKEIFVNEPIDKVFEFFNTPLNLQKITPPFMNFKLLTPGKIVMKDGAVFDYKISLLGIPIRWTSYICDYDPPYQFSDIQLQGPHSYWHHQHIFESVDNGTLIKDIVHYEMPFGFLGRLGNFFIGKPLNNAMFNHRTKVVESLFGQDER